MNTVTIKVNMEIPVGATHFSGDLLDSPTFHKCKQIGVVGDHWFYLNGKGVWIFNGHTKPHWIKSIEEEINK